LVRSWVLRYSSNSHTNSAGMNSFSSHFKTLGSL
jgi:hypothetical protein